ncbi:peptidoglycan -binding protein [Paramagnetospirillum magneticum]|uniref:Flagellar motor protein n=1 Tax=Paramagnetospirillum magneticum (strain ATCC 700264 / AMB-1) TaxID=342108 RepID=Q2W7T2_PARM1|nr:peptidoglycan -binding protein [Paramagnetospirillum magneticum]BAE50093.1 Flagellar motor protein [Paramagnetospirillum magneticum AMB-1]
MPLGRRARRSVDIWPGFVDALATLIMVVVFLLMIFVLAQFFLGQALSGRQKALDDLGREMAALAEKLNLQTKANAALQAELVSSRAEKEKLEHWAAGVQQDMAALLTLKDEKEAELAAEKKISDEGRAQLALLSRQIEALKEELARVAAALDASETRDKEQKAQISDLGKRLNVALAGKVEELQKYRSEFFGRLRKVLGDRPGIRIEGDRFVFQSELLFATGSAELGTEGAEQVRKLAATIREINAGMPKGLNWVLRVDGHTDKRPITSGKFPSNWELSTARAITVLRALAADGVPRDRLAAAGFGEFQPVDSGNTEAAYAKNRRIEIRFDQR